MIHELSWIEYGVGDVYLFETDKPFEEFKVDCDKALVECFDEYMKQERVYASLREWICFTIKTIEGYGYKRIETEKYEFYGNAIPRQEDGRIDSVVSQFTEQVIKMRDCNTQKELKRST